MTIETGNTLAQAQIEADDATIAAIESALDAAVDAKTDGATAKETAQNAGDAILDAVRSNPLDALVKFYKVKGWKARFVMPSGDSYNVAGNTPDKDTAEGVAFKTLGIYRSHILTFLNREGSGALEGVTMTEIRKANKEANADPLKEDIRELQSEINKTLNGDRDAMARYRQVLKEVLASEKTRGENVKAQAAA